MFCQLSNMIVALYTFALKIDPSSTPTGLSCTTAFPWSDRQHLSLLACHDERPPHRLYLKLNHPPAHPQDYHLQAEVFKEKLMLLEPQ